jgi:hypothetical protein
MSVRIFRFCNTDDRSFLLPEAQSQVNNPLSGFPQFTHRFVDKLPGLAISTESSRIKTLQNAPRTRAKPDTAFVGAA